MGGEKRARGKTGQSAPANHKTNHKPNHNHHDNETNHNK